MPQKGKDYVRFAVEQYAKKKKFRQQELAKEKASLSNEVKTLQQQMQRPDNKIFKLEDKFLPTILIHNCNEDWNEV